MNPAVKVLMKLKKDQLLYKATEYRLVSCRHTKIELATAIAKHEARLEMFSAAWKAIAK